MLEGGFTIARDLQSDRWGAPKHLLRLAVLLDDVKEDFYMTRPAAQLALRAFASLAPLGRLLGCAALRDTPGGGEAPRAAGNVTVGGAILLLLALYVLWRRRRSQRG